MAQIAGEIKPNPVTPRRLRRRRYDAALVAAFLQGKSVADAAEDAGVSESTARKRLADPEFREQLDDAAHVVHDKVLDDMVEATGLAVSFLTSVLEDEEASRTAKLQAARILMTSGGKVIGRSGATRQQQERVDTETEGVEPQKKVAIRWGNQGS